jgi:signal transduction histidine kinase
VFGAIAYHQAVRAIRILRAPVALDAGLALLLLGASLLLGKRVFFADGDDTKAVAYFGSMAAFRQHLLWWWLAAIPAVAAVVLRWRWPLVAFLLAGASALAHALDLKLRLVGLSLLPLDLAALIALYTLASVTRRRRTGLIALAAAVAVHVPAILWALDNTEWLGQRLVLSTFADPDARVTATVGTALLMTALPALLLGIAWVVGDSTRTHRLRREASEQQAAAAKREQEQRAALAVAGERARITRELHDVVAHGISVMVVQAQAAEAALRNEPDTAATALGHVIDTGFAAMTEMRRLLGVVRQASDPSAPLAPQPGVSALPDLIDQVRQAGTPVTLLVDGAPVPLPAAVDVSAYRIVQEALTNTRRHAGSAACATFRLSYGDARLEIEVADDGAGPPARPSHVDGNGLRGIAERVGALGGIVEAGPRSGGGFGVHAVLPTAAVPA